jgi:hypothetical protein
MIVLAMLLFACKPGVQADATCGDLQSCASWQGDETSANDLEYRECHTCNEHTDECVDFLEDPDGNIVERCDDGDGDPCDVWDYCEVSS